MDFVEKRSSYLEKASHSIEKKRFVVQNAGGQPLLWNFKGDYIHSYLSFLLFVSIYLLICTVVCMCVYMNTEYI